MSLTLRTQSGPTLFSVSNVMLLLALVQSSLVIGLVSGSTDPPLPVLELDDSDLVPLSTQVTSRGMYVPDDKMLVRPKLLFARTKYPHHTARIHQPIATAHRPWAQTMVGTGSPPKRQEVPKMGPVEVHSEEHEAMPAAGHEAGDGADGADGGEGEGDDGGDEEEEGGETTAHAMADEVAGDSKDKGDAPATATATHK